MVSIQTRNVTSEWLIQPGNCAQFICIHTLVTKQYTYTYICVSEVSLFLRGTFHYANVNCQFVEIS